MRMPILIVTLVFVLSTLPLIADPVVISFTGTQSLGSPGIPGTTTQFVLSFTVDNGNNTLVNQNWQGVSVVSMSAMFTSGTYVAQYSTLSPFGMFVFGTDASGNLYTAWFAGSLMGSPGSDSLSGSLAPEFHSAYVTGVPEGFAPFEIADSTGARNFILDEPTQRRLFIPENLHGWTLEGFASVVPEPSTLTLLGIGILGLIGYGWRKGR